MFQLSNTQTSDDYQEECPTLGIVSTINDLLIPCLLSVNLSLSLAKQGFETLLLDLNITQPTLSFLLHDKGYFDFTTNQIFEKKINFDDIESSILTERFSSGGLLSIIPSSIDIRSRLKVQESSNRDAKGNLVKLMDFINSCKSKYNFIVINMPNSSDLQQLSQACLVSDHIFLLLDQSSISITFGLDLVTNLESIHPLIKIEALILYNYNYGVNFVEDERPLIEQALNLPIAVTLPALPDDKILTFTDSDIRLQNYYKIYAQELFKFIHNSPQMPLSLVDNEIIEVLIIANKAGIPLFTSYLKQEERHSDKSTILSQDEILASATLTAVVTGITEVIKEITRDLSGETKLIKQKHLNLVIEYDSPLRAMMLTKRNEEAVRSKIIFFLGLFKKKYKSEIEGFMGFSKVFSAAQSLVEEVF